jgi:hypothetical protein
MRYAKALIDVFYCTPVEKSKSKETLLLSGRRSDGHDVSWNPGNETDAQSSAGMWGLGCMLTA